MNITVGKWCFNPGLFISFLALLFFILFVRLGVWQLERAAYKAELYESFLSRQQALPEELNNVPTEENAPTLLWQKVKATGKFREDVQILLDNRVVNGQAGYFIYTPFILHDQQTMILVNRGWLSGGKERSVLPELEKTTDMITISGVLKAEPKTGVLLAEAPPEKLSENIFRVQEIKLEKLQGFLNLPLSPMILRLDESSPAGYWRDWPLPGSDEQMHLGYAYQWFAFAATLLIIYLVLNIKKIKTDE